MSNFPPQGGFPDQGGFPPQGGFGGGAAAPPQKSSKKWLFIAGGGCLLLVIIGVVAVVGLVGFGVYGLATSEASLAAQAFVQQSGTIKAELGEPLSTTWSGGNIEINNGIGKAQQVILVTGPKGAGTVTVILASSNDGPWSVTQADYTGPNGKTTKLK
ncbi:MAG: hypothetical protein IT175_09305 [Acidobacteria bacterium]|nr:hypothetical protein [Acidobacteriota bacterium]